MCANKRMAVTRPVQNVCLPGVSIQPWVKNLIYSNTSGKVHSVFSHTINWETSANRLACLVDSNGGDVPFGVSVKVRKHFSFEKVGIYPGDFVFVFNNQIRFNHDTLVVDLAQLEITDHPTPLRRSHRPPVSARLNEVLSLLIKAPETRAGCKRILQALCQVYGLVPLVNPENDLFYSKIITKLCNIRKSFIKNDYENLGKEMRSLIGLGLGLTPTGDDVAIGFLAAWNACRKRDVNFGNFEKLTNNLKEHYQGKTSRISEEFLFHALEMRFSDRVADFIQAFSNGGADQIVSSAAKLFRYGATSGVDTGLGVVLGFGLQLESDSDLLALLHEFKGM